MFFFNFFGFLDFFKKKFNFFFFSKDSYSQPFYKYTGPDDFKKYSLTQETVNNVFFQISQKLNLGNNAAGSVYNPYRFEVIYRNYIFFSKYNNFKKSFEVLNNY
jgi:hypothetical protein